MSQPGDSRASGTDLLVVFWPLLALGALTMLLAALAALFGWYSHEMLITAVISGAVMVTLVGWLTYRHLNERRAAGRALRNVEARVSGILDSAMDAIITCDEHQRVVLFNATAEKVFRWPRQAVIGQPLEMLIPERFRERHRSHIEVFSQAGVTSRGMGGQMVLLGLRANGEEFPIEASISQHTEDERKFFTVILRDVTERQRAAQAQARDE